VLRGKVRQAVGKAAEPSRASPQLTMDCSSTLRVAAVSGTCLVQTTMFKTTSQIILDFGLLIEARGSSYQIARIQVIIAWRNPRFRANSSGVSKLLCVDHADGFSGEAATGRVNQNVLPLPGSLSKPIWPQARSTHLKHTNSNGVVQFGQAGRIKCSHGNAAVAGCLK